MSKQIPTGTRGMRITLLGDNSESYSIEGLGLEYPELLEWLADQVRQDLERRARDE